LINSQQSFSGESAIDHGTRHEKKEGFLRKKKFPGRALDLRLHGGDHVTDENLFLHQTGKVQGKAINKGKGVLF